MPDQLGASLSELTEHSSVWESCSGLQYHFAGALGIPADVNVAIAGALLGADATPTGDGLVEFGSADSA
eukprot:587472-Alexandrium_andersonii.AAC.1